MGLTLHPAVDVGAVFLPCRDLHRAQHLYEQAREQAAASKAEIVLLDLPHDLLRFADRVGDYDLPRRGKGRLGGLRSDALAPNFF